MRLAVGHKYHTLFCTTIPRTKLHIDRKTSVLDTSVKTKATKRRGPSMTTKRKLTATRLKQIMSLHRTKQLRK